jgi:hypothetical protein
MRKKHHNYTLGFTLLFASVIVSLILSIGLAIAHLTLRQLILSTAGRESQYAFYNADSGVECALFYMNMTRPSGGMPWFAFNGDDSPPDRMYCAGKNAMFMDIDESSGTTTTTFYVNAPTSMGVGMIADIDYEPCQKDEPTFEVKVHRRKRATSDLVDTYIESRGYNTCDITNPRRVERGLYVRLVD